MHISTNGLSTIGLLVIVNLSTNEDKMTQQNSGSTETIISTADIFFVSLRTRKMYTHTKTGDVIGIPEVEL